MVAALHGPGASFPQRERESVPAWLAEAVRRAGTFVSDGLPQHTWNGMTGETHAVGSKSGKTRWVHLLPPGIHPAHVDEARRRFVWNDVRAALWQRLEALAPELLRRGVTHIAGAGSFFTTDFPTPGDMDVVAFGPAEPRRTGPLYFSDVNRAQGEGGVHVYWHKESIFFSGGPSVLATGMRNAPPSPPRRPALSPGAPQGPEVGLVLLEVAAI